MLKTMNNLAAAFIGEAQARNRYTFYASKAKKEGLMQVMEIFSLTADNEKEHAAQIMDMMNSLKSKLTGQDTNKIMVAEAGVPTVLGTLEENLRSAIEGENYEYTEMYPDFAQVAIEEGLGDIASQLLAIARAEEHHEERYQKILDNVINQSFFRKEEEVEWVCRECGYVHTGKEAPLVCPSCKHAQGYYQIKCEIY